MSGCGPHPLYMSVGMMIGLFIGAVPILFYSSLMALSEIPSWIKKGGEKKQI